MRPPEQLFVTLSENHDVMVHVRPENREAALVWLKENRPQWFEWMTKGDALKLETAYAKLNAVLPRTTTRPPRRFTKYANWNSFKRSLARMNRRDEGEQKQ